MSKIDWLKELGWSEEHVEELGFAGYSYIRQGKYEIALPFYEALTILEPDNPYNAQTLGAIYLQLGKPEKALKSFDIALKLEADHGPTLLNLAKALLMLKRKDEALKLCEMLTKEPDSKIANGARALILAYGK